MMLLYNTHHSILNGWSTLGQEYRMLIDLYWKLMRRQLWIWTCPITRQHHQIGTLSDSWPSNCTKRLREKKFQSFSDIAEKYFSSKRAKSWILLELSLRLFLWLHWCFDVYNLSRGDTNVTTRAWLTTLMSDVYDAKILVLKSLLFCSFVYVQCIFLKATYSYISYQTQRCLVQEWHMKASTKIELYEQYYYIVIFRFVLLNLYQNIQNRFTKKIFLYLELFY